MAGTGKPDVWLVDDLKSNRDEFRKEHSKHFRVTVFKSAIEVLKRLRSGGARPDALLCDIYFFPKSQAKQNEKKVMEQARQIRLLSDKLHAGDHQDGIDLIEQIRLDFGKKIPFPVYGYTSKAPYLLENSGFRRISQCGARWLFKGKYTPTGLYTIIANGISEDAKSATKVLLVHGRNDRFRLSVQNFLKNLGLKVIVLSEQPDEGKTIIEKLEKYSEVGFAIILLTADDWGRLKETAANKHQSRARQNVILELGFFLGRLGRERTCLLYEQGVELPSDCDGVVYKELGAEEEWRKKIEIELRHAGLLIGKK